MTIDLSIEADGKRYGPFTEWIDVALTIRRLRAQGYKHIHLYRERFVCDFCADPTPAWEYAANDAFLAAVGSEDHASTGSWAACGTCHDLIEADDYEGLLKRAYRKWMDMHGDLDVPTSLVATMLGNVHEAFRKARIDRPPTMVPTDEQLLHGLEYGPPTAVPEPEEGASD